MEQPAEEATSAAETPVTVEETAENLADTVSEPMEFTGQAAVDAVLASLESLDDLPVAEHVEVFDRAHQGLRQALDDAGRAAAPDADD